MVHPQAGPFQPRLRYERIRFVLSCDHVCNTRYRAAAARFSGAASTFDCALRFRKRATNSTSCAPPDTPEAGAAYQNEALPELTRRWVGDLTESREAPPFEAAAPVHAECGAPLRVGSTAVLSVQNRSAIGVGSRENVRGLSELRFSLAVRPLSRVSYSRVHRSRVLQRCHEYRGTSSMIRPRYSHAPLILRTAPWSIAVASTCVPERRLPRGDQIVQLRRSNPSMLRRSGRLQCHRPSALFGLGIE